MKKLTKALCLIIVLAVFAGFAIGSGSSDDSTGKGIETSAPSADTEGSAGSQITIEEQILLERDGVKITAKSYEVDKLWGEGIKLLVENSSDKNLVIGCDALIVNNYMITDLFSCDVAAGKKANETIYLLSSELKAAGIENVGQIEIYFRAYDSDSYDDIFKKEAVTIQTSAYADMDTTPADGGTELYNQDGIRIVGKLVDENSFWGTAVLLYMENTTGKNITISCENMSINGFMVTPYFSCTIYDGKMAFDEITILSSDLEANDISTIEDIELSFHIYNSDTYDVIADTDPIAFSPA